MWQLPALVVGNKTVRLPLTDWAAQQISAALLAEGAEQRHSFLCQALREEPPLLLWVLCRAPAFREAPPRSIEEVAAWLASVALAVFADFAPRQPSCTPIGDDVRRRWADLAVRAATSDTSRTPCELELSTTSGTAQFQRRIADPQAWVLDFEERHDFAPGWLQVNATAADSAGIETLSAPSTADPNSPDQEIRRRWLEEQTPSVNLLGPLVKRLLRLEKLEHDFAGQLREAKLASLKELAYGASHEINNPLANISTRAQTLLADERDSERRRKLATIAAQAFRAHEMISDLMLFARPPVLRRQRVDLVGIVSAVLQEFAAEARAQQVILRRAGMDGPLWAEVDPTQLGVALNALVRNSLEALDGPGEVEVTLSLAVDATNTTEETMVLISVRDTGPGIAPGARPHLFDPFYSGREAGRGLGFGLSKCWRIATDHGGNIQAQDAEGGGTIFVMRLPLTGNPVMPG